MLIVESYWGCDWCGQGPVPLVSIRWTDSLVLSVWGWLNILESLSPGR